MSFDPKYNTARYALRKDTKSKVRGVAWDKDRQKWRAYAAHEGRQISLGYYDDILDAVDASVGFRLAHYPPPDPNPVCSRCKEFPARGRKYCMRCEGRAYRERKAEREGKTPPPYKRRRSRTWSGSV